MQTRVTKWGSSKGIRIPKYLLEALKLAENDYVELQEKDGALIVRKCDRRKNIADLFANFNGDYEQIKPGWDSPQGGEIW